MMGKLVLLDGNSIANRAFYALPLLSNKQGVYTNAVYGFTQILLKILEDIKPEYLLVAFDAGKITFRHTNFAEYKGKRQKTPSELSGQFPLIKEVLDAFNVKHFEITGYEADDIIGTMSKLSESKNIDTIIYTGDKDMLQLASDKVSIYLTRKGITEVDVFGPKEIMEKYELTPQQIIDLKGLMGDASDNIPGVPGVGEKTALKLLKDYQTVEGVLEHIDEISGKKLNENLVNNKEIALLSKELATIYREVPIEFSLDNLKYTKYEKSNIYHIFNTLEFSTLIERLGLEEGREVIEFEEIEFDYSLLNEVNRGKWEGIFTNKEPLALHIETESLELQNYKIHGLALSNGQENLFISEEDLLKWDAFKEWLQDSDAVKFVYDSKLTDLSLFWNGLKIEGMNFDLMLATYLLNPSDGTISLADTARNYGYKGLKSDEAFFGKGAKRAIPESSLVAEYISRKANAIYHLVPIITEELNKNNQMSLLVDLEQPLAKVLGEMEKTGVLIDVNILQQMGEEVNNKLSDLTKEIYNEAGLEFNINSPKQLGEVLFDKLQLPIIKKTKTGYSTSADILEKLESYHPIISHILNYRQLGKLYSTYIEGLVRMVNPITGKIHTSFNQAITATGRLSSTEPNLQNIPIRLEEGKKIRQAFIPSETNWVIIAADYSQIELRVLAHISNDKNLTEAFEADMDVHTKTAMDVFGIENEADVTSLMRRQAKAVNFGIVYGISDYGLSQNLNISRKEAGQFIDKYFEVFSGVKEYMDEIVKQAKKDGYVSTLLNRRRYLPDIKSPNFNIRSFAERTAMNTPIQGTAADIIKLAMIKLADLIQEKGLKSRLLLQVHDELILEVPPEEVEEMVEMIKEAMEGAIELNVPLKVDINVGQTWYEAK